MFLKHFTPLHQTIGMIFKAVNFSTYHNYMRIFHCQLDFTALDVLHTTKRMCFIRVAVNRNNKVILHKDFNDFCDGWAAICNFEGFENEELYFSTMSIMTKDGEKKGVKIWYGPGDVIFFRATLFEHWLNNYEEKRTALVYHNKNTCWLKNMVGRYVVILIRLRNLLVAYSLLHHVNSKFVAWRLNFHW